MIRGLLKNTGRPTAPSYAPRAMTSVLILTKFALYKEELAEGTSLFRTGSHLF